VKPLGSSAQRPAFQKITSWETDRRNLIIEKGGQPGFGNLFKGAAGPSRWAAKRVIRGTKGELPIEKLRRGHDKKKKGSPAERQVSSEVIVMGLFCAHNKRRKRTTFTPKTC